MKAHRDEGLIHIDAFFRGRFEEWNTKFGSYRLGLLARYLSHAFQVRLVAHLENASIDGARETSRADQNEREGGIFAHAGDLLPNVYRVLEALRCCDRVHQQESVAGPIPLIGPTKDKKGNEE